MRTWTKVASLPFLLAALTACAASAKPAPTFAPNPAITQIAASDEEQNVPFRLIVSQELNDGATLFVSGQLVARNRWNPADTLVRLSTLAQGELKQEVFFSPVESLGSGMAEPQEVPFALRLPASGVSDYQLEVLWGAEAQPFLFKLRGGQVQLKVQNTSLRPCSESACAAPAQILTQLYNSGENVIETAVLGLTLSLKDQKDGSLSSEEQRLDLTSLSLDPGKTKLLRLSIDKPITVDTIARLEPRLRVISYVER